MWYALSGWGRTVEELPGVEAFAYHTRQAYPAILGAIMMAVVVETAAVHFLVTLWLGNVAWVLTGLGIYSMVWMVGDYHAARMKPFLATEMGLRLDTGLRWRAHVSWEEILSIHDDAPTEPSMPLTLLGKPDFWIECRDAVPVAGPFGIKRTVRFLGVGADDPASFRSEISSRLPAES